MSKFAANTSVSVNKSKAEIEAIVERYGATGFMSAWTTDKALIAFAMEGRQVRFTLSMPLKSNPEFTEYKQGRSTFLRTEAQALARWEQACRQRWRALALVIKAKLEAVETGISVFEDEFMANVVMPNGRTVSEEVRPLIAEAYATGKVQALLPDYSA